MRVFVLVVVLAGCGDGAADVQRYGWTLAPVPCSQRAGNLRGSLDIGTENAIVQVVRESADGEQRVVTHTQRGTVIDFTCEPDPPAGPLSYHVRWIGPASPD